MAWLDDVRALFGQAGVPEWIWMPIARQESSLNPASHNTAGEDSRGLFQINLDAHPQYAAYDLFDPVTNARIALRDFIMPAYEQAASMTDPGEQAAYVWRYGIRPDWRGVVARGADQQLMSEARSIAGGTAVPLDPGTLPTGGGGGGGGGLQPAFNPFTWAGSSLLGDLGKKDVWIQAGIWIVFALALVLLFVGGFWGLGKAFGADGALADLGKKAAKAVA